MFQNDPKLSRTIHKIVQNEAKALQNNKSFEQAM